MLPYILGIHGLLPDMQARGLHDASYCSYDPNSDRLLALVELEKRSGIRHEPNIDSGMLQSGMDCFPQNEWDIVTSHFSPLRPAVPIEFPLFSEVDTLWRSDIHYCTKQEIIFSGRKCFHFIYLHELAHVFSAFMFREKDYDEFLGLVVEGSGSFAQSALFRVTGFRIELLEYNLPVLSGNFFHQWLSRLVFGAGRQDHRGRAATPGKIMGMAAFGDPRRFYDTLKNALKKYRPSEYVNYREGFCADIESRNLSWRDRLDLAASGQRLFEDLLEKEARRIRKQYGNLPLCYAGGCALSVKANSRLRGVFADLIIPPNCADDGQSLGLAALHAFCQHHKYLTPLSPDSGVFAPSESRFFIPGKLTPDDRAQVVSWLKHGEVVGFAQGAPEIGPRALCRRSILASPECAHMRQVLNQIKGREYFRPVAPVVLHSEGSRYFEKYFYSPYMLYDFPVRQEWKPYIPAAVHEDGTARVQSIADGQSDIAFILKEFAQKTGRPPVLLNTSLNSQGKPIAGDIQQVLEEMERLQINHYVIGGALKDRSDKDKNDIAVPLASCGIQAVQKAPGWQFASSAGRFSSFMAHSRLIRHEMGEGEIQAGPYKAFFHQTFMRLLFDDGSVFLVYPSGHIRWIPKESFQYYALLSQGLPPAYWQGDLVVFDFGELPSPLVSALEERLPEQQGGWWCRAAAAALMPKKWYPAEQIMLGGNNRHRAFGRFRYRAPIRRDCRTLELYTVSPIRVRHTPTDHIHPVIDLPAGKKFLFTKLPGFSDPEQEMITQNIAANDVHKRLR
ncbi:MAG: hypothetical protein IPH12_07735 [Saprospirales bacterium]|nr:hypothetical protein [Saprospirales bacterium]